MTNEPLDLLCINTIRTLSMDAVQGELGPSRDAHGDGAGGRMVSMPSWELFDRQPQAYRDEVLPPEVTARVSVEQASTFGWERFVGLAGQTIGMHTFGASAPLAALKRRFGFTPDHVVATARALVRPAAQPEMETRSSR